MPTPMNCLPVVVDEPGEYRARCGNVVIVTKVEDHGPLNVTRFNCKGYLVHRRRPGKRDRYEFHIWHQSGFFVAVGEHDYDIVEKLS